MTVYTYIKSFFASINLMIIISQEIQSTKHVHKMRKGITMCNFSSIKIINYKTKLLASFYFMNG